MRPSPFSTAACGRLGQADVNGCSTFQCPALAMAATRLTASATDAAGNALGGHQPRRSRWTRRRLRRRRSSSSLPAQTESSPCSTERARSAPRSSWSYRRRMIGQAQVDSARQMGDCTDPAANGDSVSACGRSTSPTRTSAGTALAFTINSTLNRTGSAGDDTLSGTFGHDVLAGLAGIDTAVPVASAARHGGAINQWLYHLVAADGRDSLWRRTIPFSMARWHWTSR